MSASFNGHAAMLRWLISKGLNIFKSFIGYRCMQVAILNLHEDIVAMLLKEGVVTDRDQACMLYSPLKSVSKSYAPVLLAQVCQGGKGIHRLLLQHGAKPIDPTESILAHRFADGFCPTKCPKWR